MANKTPLAVPTFLEQWREYRGLTQQKLAAMVGVEPPSVSMLQNGVMGFTDKTLAKYAEALNCTPAQLLAHDPTRPDSFWPLFQKAESLTGPNREQLLAVLKGFLGPLEDGSK